MLKKILIGLIIFTGLVMVAVASLFIWARGSAPKTDKQFLSQLKGEIVFTRMNSEGVSDIWKVNADGTGEKMLYHNDKNKTRTSFPYWSLDGSKIYFLMYDLTKREQQIYEMDADGENIQLAENPDRKPEEDNWLSKGANLKVVKGDLYIIQNGQKKLIYDARYDGKFYMGVSNVSWSPDKKYIIFKVDGLIIVADTNGRFTKLTDGSAPDWKY